MLPLGTTCAAARAPRTNGAASAVVATTVLNKVRRLSLILSVVSSLRESLAASVIQPCKIVSGVLPIGNIDRVGTFREDWYKRDIKRRL